MIREVRNAVHQKQNRMQIQKGIPDVAELSEVVPVLRSVPGIGIVEYIRYNGQLYSSAYSTAEPIVSNTSKNISLLNDGSVGDESFPGTVSNIVNATAYSDLYPQDSSVEATWGFSSEVRADSVANSLNALIDDVGALAGKINEIIRVLRKANIIGADGKFGDTHSV